MDSSAVNNSVFGDVLTLASAALFALVSVMLRKVAPEGFDLSYFMGMNGLLAIGLSPGVLYVAHHWGVEHFRPPTADALLALTINAVLGSTCANYLYTSALLLLSPLVTTVCMSLSIPISAFTDELLMREHRFSTGWFIGASFVSASVVFAAFDLEAAPETSSSARGEAGEEEELKGLLEHEGSQDHDRGRDGEHGQELRHV
jgi:drug/metabolite transporter (DMT)-like permease